jgi:hypothetical protein
MRKLFADWAEALASWCSNNLREGALTPNIYEPALNPLYRDVLRRSASMPRARRSNVFLRSVRGLLPTSFRFPFTVFM